MSSKSHWDVPVVIGGATVHFLTSHPTPPVFDGPEDRNGTRNYDEIRFWADYIDQSTSGYIYDDDGVFGGLSGDDRFVIAGDLNSDPLDGDSIPGVIRSCWTMPKVNTTDHPPAASCRARFPQGWHQRLSPQRPGVRHRQTSAISAPGNLRADYVLPSRNMNAWLDAGVFWPLESDPLFGLVGTFPFPSVCTTARCGSI